MSPGGKLKVIWDDEGITRGLRFGIRVSRYLTYAELHNTPYQLEKLP